MRNKQLKPGDKVYINPSWTICDQYDTGFRAALVGKIHNKSDQIRCSFYDESKEHIIHCWVSSDDVSESN